MACRYLYKGQLYTEEQLAKLPEFNREFGFEQLQREFVLNNTGPNTNHTVELFSPSSEVEAGVFVKFTQFKESQIREYKKRLNKIELEKKKKGVTTERLNQLNKLERELNLEVYGNFELGIKGLVREIAELKDNASIEAVGYYVEKDKSRLGKLAYSDSIDDLHEAQRIIDFYTLAGTFRRNVDNPFFNQEDMFITDEDGNLTSEFALNDDVMDKFKKWKDDVTQYQNILDKRKEEVTVNTINNDITVKNLYKDKQFSFSEIVQDETGLKDTDWISMWTMDITQGIFSTNGIIPQVMFSYLSNSFERKLKWAKDIEEKIDEMSPNVEKELIKMGYSLRGSGILGIRGASYQLFKEITKEGNETGGLVQRFIKEYFDAQSSALNNFNTKFEIAKTYQDYNQKVAAFNKAFEELKRWRRTNNIIVEIDKIPELHESGEFSDIIPSNNSSEDYKNELIDILGKKGYKEQVDKQTQLLRKYKSEKQSMIDTLLIMENKTDFESLSDKAKSDLEYWEHNHNPLKGIEEYYSIGSMFFGGRKVNNFMDYNSFVPRKYVTEMSGLPSGKYQFVNTSKLTGHYNTTFEKIESNNVLNKYYDIIKEVCETVRENMPYDLQQKVAINTVPALLKTSSEIIADKNTGILNSLFLAFKNLSERIRLGFGVVKQSEFSHATTDPITGKANYKVNDIFISGNSRAVQERMTIEKLKFAQIYGRMVGGISRFTSIPLSTMNEGSLVMLADYLHVDISLADIRSGNLSKIKERTGDNVQIGKYIRDYSLHSVVQSQSFDLSKIAKYFSNMTMSYAARQESLPILEIMKQHYQGIQKPLTNNLGRGIYNVNDEEYMKEGVRTNANKQMDDWFERVALDNYGTKHVGPHGNKSRDSKELSEIDKQLKIIEEKLEGKLSQPERDRLVSEREKLLIKQYIPGYGKTIYGAEDKIKIGEIETLLRNNTLSDDERAKLIKIREGLGKARTATAFFDNIWGFIRTMRLGYNISSATTNFAEGVTSNMILAATGDYFDSNEIYYGYSVVKRSFLKNVTFGLAETMEARKNRSLMDKFNVIMDSKNELQKSSVKSYSSKFSWLSPHELNQRVEYINQSPIMIAMLRTLKIKDKQGKEESIWDAMDKDGHLIDSFKTEENINNWENLSGDQYLTFKQKLHKAIVLGHGNYHDLRGMMIKSSAAGKGLMMFKTWIPMQLYTRFASDQDDLQGGTINFKGRNRSYSATGMAAHIGIVGTAAFGPLGAVAGGVLGYFLGRNFGTDTGVPMIKQLVEINKQLFKKALGMPVNILSWAVSGKGLIKPSGKEFDNWVGRGNFTSTDAKNMRANMSDLSIQLAWLGMILLVKGMLWDDDDTPDDPERIAHNILVNKLMQLSSQAGMYVNPVDIYKSTIGSNAVIQYLTDVGKEIDKVSNWLHGRDLVQSGINAGESGLWNQTKKTFLPGFFKDSFFGFETQAEKVFEESPFHQYFRSEETLDKAENKAERAARKNELEEQGLEDSEIRKILDEELPTPARLKKLDVTRKEYEEYLKSQKEEEE